MNIKNFLGQEIYGEHFDGCPVFMEMTGAGFTRSLYNGPIFAYEITFAYYKKGEGDWMTLVSDQEKVGRNVISLYLSNKNTLKDLYKRWLKNFNEMVKQYPIWRKKDIESFSDKDLWKWANDFYIFCRDTVSMPGFIDGYMFYADKRFDELLRKFCEEKGIENYKTIFSVLSSPIEQSFINEEEEALEAIIKLMIKSGMNPKGDILDFISKNKKIEKIIQKHLEKYSWIKSSYNGYKEYKVDGIVGEIKNYKKKSKKESSEYVLLKNKKDKDVLIRKYKFTPEILAIAEITERLIKWQDQRKNYTLMYATIQERIIREVSRRKGIDLELLRFCSLDDIKKALLGRLDVSELKKRRNSCIFVCKNGVLQEIVTGKDAKHFMKKATEVKVSETTEIKGMTASIGKVTGRVVVLMSVKQLDKVREGDIIVSPMTRPEHLAGMKKAAAIITDDGGITCHAAIVARELKKPCIIGTRIATKVLKDGMMVEVDANHGVIKILK